jgi:hypothetical protein
MGGDDGFREEATMSRTLSIALAAAISVFLGFPAHAQDVTAGNYL